MFRLEVIPYRPPKSDAPPPSQQIYHTCLNTTYTPVADDFKHCIASIGRKNSDITFEQDKCVSRRHAYLYLKHNRDDDLNLYEKQSCEEDAHNVCLFIEDNGSKFGTTIISPTPIGVSGKIGSDTEDTSEDATDDEECSKDSNGMYKMKLLPKNPILLSAVTSKFISSSNRTVSIQFGVSGSTIKITRIPFSFCFTTLENDCQVPTAFQMERIGVSYTKAWIVPGEEKEDSKTIPTTHLISNQFKTSAKFLTAYVSQTPICTLDYLHALLNRKSMKDPLPCTQKYIPPLSSHPNISMTASSSTLFQNLHQQLLESSSNDRILTKPLQNFLFLVYANDEVCKLVQMAGASIYPLYALSETIYYHSPWYNTSLPNDKNIVVLDSNSRKIRRRKETLMEVIFPKMQESVNTCWHLTTAKEVAQSLTNSDRRLRDSRGNVILEQKTDENNHDEDFMTEDTQKEEEVMDGNSKKNASAIKTRMTDIHAPPNDTQIYKKATLNESQDLDSSPSRTRRHSDQNRDTDLAEPKASQLEQPTIRRKKRNASQEEIHDLDVTSQSSFRTQTKRVKRSTKNTNTSSWTSSKNSNPTLASQHSTSSHKEYESTTSTSIVCQTRHDSKPNSSSQSQKQLSPIIEQDNSSSYQSAISDNSVNDRKINRKRLQKRNGWYVAAPSDSALRQEYKRNHLQVSISLPSNIEGGHNTNEFYPTNEETELTNLAMTTAAHTESRPDLIVQRTNTPQPSNSFRPRKLDFKKFRKNYILTSSPRAITFISMLPKESEREIQLQLSHQELEKEQMVAEALFAEGICSSGKRRSGRGRGGRSKTASSRTSSQNSIMQYMSQSPSMEGGNSRIRQRGMRR